MRCAALLFELECLEYEPFLEDAIVTNYAHIYPVYHFFQCSLANHFQKHSHNHLNAGHIQETHCYLVLLPKFRIPLTLNVWQATGGIKGYIGKACPLALYHGIFRKTFPDKTFGLLKLL